LSAGKSSLKGRFKSGLREFLSIFKAIECEGGNEYKEGLGRKQPLKKVAFLPNSVLRNTPVKWRKTLESHYFGCDLCM
jgi:hypothetical protein